MCRPIVVAAFALRCSSAALARAAIRRAASACTSTTPSVSARRMASACRSTVPSAGAPEEEEEEEVERRRPPPVSDIFLSDFILRERVAEKREADDVRELAPGLPKTRCESPGVNARADTIVSLYLELRLQRDVVARVAPAGQPLGVELVLVGRQ